MLVTPAFLAVVTLQFPWRSALSQLPNASGNEGEKIPSAPKHIYTHTIETTWSTWFRGLLTMIICERDISGFCATNANKILTGSKHLQLPYWKYTCVYEAQRIGAFVSFFLEIEKGT